MSDRSAALVEVGRAYLEEHAPPGYVASTTGGSVARGEADDLSDLDINIYVDSGEGYSANRVFAGEVIQIHVQPMPTVEEVRQSTWSYRFLREAGIVSDPTGKYESFAREALSWLDSPEGRAAAHAGALADVSDRRSWADRALQDGNRLEAGMASVAAMTDAAMLYRAAISANVGTGTPLTDVDLSHRTEPLVPWRSVRLEEADVLLEGLSGYRLILAERRGAQEDFVLDDVQVDMTSHKVARTVRQRNRLRLGETLYHTTFWLLRTRGDQPFADHLASLPGPVLSALRRMGYDEPGPKTVHRRLIWADQVCTAASSA